MISGCFRAFDRRPMEATVGGPERRGKKTVQMARSPETSCSVPGTAEISGECAGSCSNWGMVEEDEEFEEALWEWDQIDFGPRIQKIN